MIYWKKNKIKNKHVEITLTPLIDTALVLLVIFIVATPVINNGLNINLPKSNINESNSKIQDLIVFIDKDSKIYLSDRPVTFESLKNELNNIIAQNKKANVRGQKIFVNADQSISYGTLISVVDKIKSVDGVDNVILSTERAA